MPSRLIQLLLLAAALSASGAFVVLLSPGVGSAPPRTEVLARPSHQQPATAPTLLPTVSVRGVAPIPQLATITVRPLKPVIAGLPTVALASLSGVHAVATALPGGAFGMPYYSFGKPMRHLSKD